uniref:M23 family metallopeptidase n=1 Tax=Gracilinema caldarium TaxID=215591 RepID=A0A7C3E7Q2_9SPIR
MSNSFFPQGNGLSGMVSSIAGTGPMGVIANTAMTGLQTITTSTLNSAINAVNLQYDKDGNLLGLGWSSDAFNAGVQGGLISAATGMTSSLTSGMLGELNLFDGNKIGLSDKIFNTQSIKAFNSLAGSLAGQGVNFALTGDFTLNVLNFGMFGVNDRNGNLVKNGLLELHLGRNGATMNVGMGGADVSLGTVAESMSGLRDTLKISGAKLASLVGNYEGVSTLNAVNMLGYSADMNNFALGRAIWGDMIKVRYGDTGDDLGNYDSTKPGEIQLSRTLLGNNRDLAAQLATVMAHEGVHERGIRLESEAHEQGLRTYGAIVEAFGLNKDQAFTQQMLLGLLQAQSYQENQGDVDHWKAIKNADGSFRMIWDNSTTLDLSELDPNILKDLGLDRVVAADKIKQNAGLIAQLFAGQFSVEDIQSIGTVSESAETAKAKIKAYEKDIRDYKQKDELRSGIETAVTGFTGVLYGLQERGIISGNGEEIDTTNLMGSGTVDDPYSPMRILSDTGLPVTTLYGWRLVDKGLAKAGSSYTLYNFSPYFHIGIDIGQKGEYIASVAGTISLSMADNANGLSSNLSFDGNKTLTYAHNGAGAIDAFLNAWGRTASGLTKEGALGVVAGTVIGYTGLTGAASGFHLHIGYKEGSTPKDPLSFYKNTNMFNITDEARYLTGYATQPAYNNYDLISNIRAYNTKNTTNFPIQEYIKAHPKEFPAYQYSPSNGRIYKFNPVTMRYEIMD